MNSRADVCLLLVSLCDNWRVMNQLQLLFRLENLIFFVPDFLGLIHCDLRIHRVQSFSDFFQLLILTF